jgi:hypothetical protein
VFTDVVLNNCFHCSSALVRVPTSVVDGLPPIEAEIKAYEHLCAEANRTQAASARLRRLNHRLCGVRDCRCGNHRPK